MRKASFANRILLFTMIVLLSSCGLFRRKNKCMDCPKWSMEMEKSTEEKAVNS